MKDPLEFLYLKARGEIKNALSLDEHYCRLDEERVSRWEDFQNAYCDAVVHDAIAVYDAEFAVEEAEKETAFLLGLQLGVSIGRIDLFLP